MSTIYFATDQFRVEASIGDPKDKDYLDLGLFSTFTGGDIDSEPQIVHPGGMLPAVVMGSRRTTGEITVQRAFQYGDAGLIYHLSERVGRAVVTITKQPLDADRVAKGVGFTFTGILKGLTHPEHDSESTDRAPWGITVTPDGTIKLVNAA